LLPFTGGSSNGPIFGLASLAVGGIALALATRKKQSRDS
jgi:LPXTG-motif cell wall-anchored protein